MNKPILSRYWDTRRKQTAYKIKIAGTSAFLLFTPETLADLQEQINEAMKGNNNARNI
jgi:hypothetical protein